MGFKEFFKPTKRKIILTAILLLVTTAGLLLLLNSCFCDWEDVGCSWEEGVACDLIILLRVPFMVLPNLPIALLQGVHISSTSIYRTIFFVLSLMLSAIVYILQFYVFSCVIIFVRLIVKGLEFRKNRKKDLK